MRGQAGSAVTPSTPAEPPLRVDLAARAGFDVVTLTGDFDVETAVMLMDGLRTHRTSLQPRVVVDLSRVRFLDSTAIAACVEAVRWLRARDRTMSLVGAVGQPARVLRIVGIDEIAPQYASLQAYQESVVPPT